jgi:hypothetical protein
MKCAVEMGSGAMIYIPSFINIGSDIHTHRLHDDIISLLSFLQTKESELIRIKCM